MKETDFIVHGGKLEFCGEELVASADRDTYAFLADRAPNDFIFRCEVMLLTDSESGVYFRAKGKNGVEWIVGYYLAVNPADNSVSLWKVNGGDRDNRIYQKMRYPFKKNVWYEIKIVMAGKDVQIYFNNFLLDKEPYPKFDFELGHYTHGTVGFHFGSGAAKFRNVSVTPYTAVPLDPDDSYQNPIVYGADPDILYHDGTYYLYFTDTSDMSMFQCYKSDDLVHWSDPIVVFDGKDGWGNNEYMSPNVTYKNGWFYMFYASHTAKDENGRRRAQVAYASARSPLGPFKNPVKKPLHDDAQEIGGHPFVDTDGRAYITVVRFNKGNEIWAYEVDMNDGIITPKDETIVKLMVATEDWERDYANIVEGGVIFRHNGLYYMMYAGGHYKGQYGEGYATAASPLGPYIKYEYNPIVRSSALARGVGDSIIAPAPDGGMLMFYHQHYSTMEISPRWVRMDRMKFVPDEDGGPDHLVVCGPTMTRQKAFGLCKKK